MVLGFTQSDEQFPETVAFFFPEGRSNLQDATRHFSQPKKITLSSTYMLLAAVRGGIFLALITIAVELPIQWNEIRNVQSLGSVSQLVPFIVALGQFIHVAYTTIRGKDSINYANWIRNAADPRLWKEVKETGMHLVGTLFLSEVLIVGYLVTPSPCPKRGCYQLDEEQHEMIVAAEGAPAQEEVASRESVDSTLGVEGLHGPASYGNPIESLRSSDIYLAQIGSPPRVVQ